MIKATIIKEAKHGIEYEINGMKFVAEDYGDIEDHLDDWNKDPVAWLIEEIYELIG